MDLSDLRARALLVRILRERHMQDMQDLIDRLQELVGD